MYPQPMQFPGRDLPAFPERVKSDDLVIGEVYFSVHYLDDQLLIPELRALVFAGRDLSPEDITAGTHRLYFQDHASYTRGDRWGMDHPPLDGSSEVERIEQFLSRGWFESVEDTGTSDVYVFESALDVLLRCLLHRRERAV